MPVLAGDFLRALRHALTTPPTVIGKSYRASVALIFRVVSWSRNEIHPLPASLEEFLEQEWVQNGSLEILFIKRAENSRDPWSNHVAFPGGKRNEYESDQSTAMRETLEEVGIDLRPPAAFLIGRFDDRSAWRRPRQRELVVSSFAFVLTAEVPQMQLSYSEVGAYRWVPLDFFLQQDIRKYVSHWVATPLASLAHNTLILRAAYYLLGCREFYCIGMLLPRNERFGTTGLERGEDNSTDFVLWGLTLSIVSDMLILTHYRKAPLGLPPYAIGVAPIDCIVDLFYRNFVTFPAQRRARL